MSGIGQVQFSTELYSTV